MHVHAEARSEATSIPHALQHQYVRIEQVRPQPFGGDRRKRVYDGAFRLRVRSTQSDVTPVVSVFPAKNVMNRCSKRIDFTGNR
jgi:hypothetical protein